MAKLPLGFTAGPLHKAAIGHFAQEKFLREGHNTVVNSVTNGTASLSRGKTNVAKSVDSLSRRTAKKAIRAGGDTGAAVAAERPVLAARIAGRAAVKTARQSGDKGAVKAAKELRTASVKTQRSSVDSSRMERKARRSSGGY